MDFFSGEAAGAGVGVDVDEAVAAGAEDPVMAAVEAPCDPEAETGADAEALGVVAIDDDVEGAAEVWVWVYDSPMIVRVYTSAGDCARVKILEPELAWQSQPS